jgi:hypothetical protein
LHLTTYQANNKDQRPEDKFNDERHVKKSAKPRPKQKKNLKREKSSKKTGLRTRGAARSTTRAATATPARAPVQQRRKGHHARFRKAMRHEIANLLTHGIGAGLAIAGTVFLAIRGIELRDPWRIVGYSLFGASMVFLYMSSSLYHALWHPKTKQILRRMDHSAIFFAIAGTYTPILLVTLRGPHRLDILRHCLGPCHRRHHVQDALRPPLRSRIAHNLYSNGMARRLFCETGLHRSLGSGYLVAVCRGHRLHSRYNFLFDGKATLPPHDLAPLCTDRQRAALSLHLQVCLNKAPKRLRGRSQNEKIRKSSAIFEVKIAP